MQYIKIDDEGNEHRVAVVKPDCIKIRLKEIRQFLAIKEMYLSIQFCYYEFSKYSLGALGVSKDEAKTDRKTTADGEICWKTLAYYHGNSIRVSKHLRVLEGKQLIKPLEKSKSSFPGFCRGTKVKA